MKTTGSYLLYIEEDGDWPQVMWVAEGMEEEARRDWEKEGYAFLPVVVMTEEELERRIIAVENMAYENGFYAGRGLKV